MKNLVDLNTFETSMSLKDQVIITITTITLVIFTAVYILPSLWLRVAKFFIKTLVKVSQ